jgi:hypothetical protein
MSVMEKAKSNEPMEIYNMKEISDQSAEPKAMF